MEITVDDPETWVRPYTFMIRLKKTDALIDEYACHEGDDAMEDPAAGAPRRGPSPRDGEAALTTHSLLASIRLVTADAHARLEQRVDLGVPWSRARYLGFLRATLAVVQPTAPALRAYFGDERFPLLATSAGRLHGDIAALGGTNEPFAPLEVPAVTSEAHAFGAAYVLLGSLLGGRLIARTIESQLALTPSQVTYLRPPDEVSVAWRQFTTDLNRWTGADIPRTRTAAVEMAANTFAAFEASFANEGFV